MNIIIGGTTHVIGGKAKYFFDRVKIWNELDKERATEIKGGNFEDMIKNSDIAGNLKSMLKLLHESIASFYVKKINMWVEQNPEEAKKINFEKVEKAVTQNYTDSMKQLKEMQFLVNNLVWDGSLLGGYCQMEPLIRIAQLVNFPYEIFSISMPQFKWANKPFEETESREDLLSKYETYYGILMGEIKNFIELLESQQF